MLLEDKPKASKEDEAQQQDFDLKWTANSMYSGKIVVTTGKSFVT